MLFVFLLICAMIFGARLMPSNLEYMGAFRLPDGEPFEENWYWGGRALCYFPDGDPSGDSDGHPGSLFGVGHAWNNYVAEINIPEPFDSPAKDVTDLATAEFLQPFTNIRGSMFDGVFDASCERHGLAYLPPMGDQATGKLYACFGEHYQYTPFISHMWCETDLSDTDRSGAWFFGEYPNFATNDYMCEIPSDWADEHVSGYRLASGRFRDGGLGGRGPALFAAAPWLDGNPPPAGDSLEHITPLLLYDDWEVTEEPDTLIDYKNVDEWEGVSWIAAGDTQAVIFIGTKGFGDCWYGFSDGTLWPNDSDYIPPYPHDDRGWWADSLFAVFYFYDPDDFAAVAAGTMEPGEPQPYATMRVVDYLYNVDWHQQKYQLGACAYDPERRFFYVFEYLADEDKPLCHVWHIQTGETSVSEMEDYCSPKYLNIKAYPNPFNSSISIEIPKDADKIEIYDISSSLVFSKTLESGSSSRNSQKESFHWQPKSDIESGIYIIKAIYPDKNTTNNRIVYIK